ncbi:hypothetical protein IMG5_206380 [Ichthyophthirius multifiliis]|uniref:Uncharacterized protein n=1 Tax=Ichthyophthirius multifiliis TaxID=5932 RepID=G0R6N0_ICHMU|nr:hypothetical protein IMG5_206380 [Ichthyophthirius multifiliis]EGR26875.1 hypothetical protein IMG5_206380 [Ichthyophthirius multifiliis]|eukprot:XP_004023759.1 hypothetical protein IMG5_206380 [Ichthyophthirius multifiliis]
MIECLSCQSQFTNCIRCDMNNCSICNYGYQYCGYNRKCMEVIMDPKLLTCAEGCDNCIYTLSCEKCSEGYHEVVYQQAGVYRYVKCKKSCTTINRCLDCDKNNICTSCKHPYYLDRENNQCR